MRRVAQAQFLQASFVMALGLLIGRGDGTGESGWPRISGSRDDFSGSEKLISCDQPILFELMQDDKRDSSYLRADQGEA